MWNRFLAKSTSLPKILSDDLPGNQKDSVSRICKYWTNLGDLRGLQTPLYDDTQGITDTGNGQKPQKRNSKMCEWIFHQLAAKNLNISIVQQSSIGQKKISYTCSIHYLTGQNWGLSVLKIFGRSSWPATCCPLFWALDFVVTSDKKKDTRGHWVLLDHALGVGYRISIQQ